jgi:tRNA(adenine34) deaminase
MDYDYFMKKALVQAEAALEAGEFPVGCVLVHEDSVIARPCRNDSAKAANPH